ncbi:hypothetical protein [Pelomicrobium methylotrophicum]|uniref:Uncharacterized protein n=1 Tax=Pelomicrobium methylotrophicum TaxID=2602750 RepID=A0A5C7EEE9_9PROT|nr:hypothetical protein [Pelomicrobium methylotrophicum]TXF09911.1 hypothetical protein FR698_16305 [Pelomicrobium methylotrophicum]
MWLYRVMSMSREGAGGMFYDATSSLDEAVRMAKAIQSREPSHNVTVEGEHWPELSWFQYQRHRLFGTHEGFGVNFKNKYGLEIEQIKTVWPKQSGGDV